MLANGVKVEIFDPPMCCPTGLCGPAIDPVLLDVNEMVLKLKGEGIVVERYQMTQQPHAFLNNPEVYQLILTRQLAALPITAVNGRVIKTGAYPMLDEVRGALNGIDQVESPKSQVPSPKSDLGLRTFDLGLSTWDFRLGTFDLGLSTWDFRLGT